ncbi:RadC family protein [Anaerovibrio sp. RM50]|uniref:JAB domain-containing protein n=1 Tax=Anaerovibrio sp. RM50 TaxID=1200557 RepID=UPI000488D170|nr:DNA repair protein RadC [Anaerovibrio sp. RM50]
MDKVEYQNNASLIATVLGVNEEAVSCYSIEDIMENPQIVENVGPATAKKVIAMNELARRMFEKKNKIDRPTVRCPDDSFDVIYKHMKANRYDMMKEHFVIACLDIKHHVLAVKEISCGSMTASVVHPREVFKEAIRHSSAAIILAHNHPSGDVSPSGNDITITRQLVQAGKIMDIVILDHIVLSDYGTYYSMKEHGDGDL